MISDHRHFFCHRILFRAVLEPVLLVTIVTVYQPLIATSKPYRFHQILVAWHTGLRGFIA